MADQELFRFVQSLAKDLDNGSVQLPSLPAVVVKIRNLLEEDECDFKTISAIVSSDTALVSRLFVFANSTYHNRTGEKIVNLESAIAKLGLELVKSTAMALVVRQLGLAQKQTNIKKFVGSIWSDSMRLSAMSHAIASQHQDLNDETAFLCGLLHYVGKLYILSKVSNVPELFAREDGFIEILQNWHSQVGRCIVDAWDFPADVVESMDPVEYLDDHIQRAPTMVDVVYAASKLVNADSERLQELQTLPSFRKLHLGEEMTPVVLSAYQDKLAAVQRSLA